MKSKHTSLKKYTNWDKLSCLSFYFFLTFWGNERRQKPNIPHLGQLKQKLCNHSLFQSKILNALCPIHISRDSSLYISCTYNAYPLSSKVLLHLYHAVTLPFKMCGPSWSVWCKIALAEVSVSLSWWYYALVLLAPGYWRVFLNLIIFQNRKMTSFRGIFG